MKKNTKRIIKKIPILRDMAYVLFTAEKKGLLSPIKLFKTIKYLPKYFNQLYTFKKSAKQEKYHMKIKKMFPV